MVQVYSQRVLLVTKPSSLSKPETTQERTEDQEEITSKSRLQQTTELNLRIFLAKLLIRMMVNTSSDI